MTQEIESLKGLYQECKEDALKEYFKFLTFKSISSEPEYKNDLRRCAEWLCDGIKQMGFSVELWEAAGQHPVIYASYHSGSDKPTLLIYNHYDVQPVDPLDLWSSPPFEPMIQNGEVFARGAQDNKGQCFYVLQALKLLLKRDGSLPINIKLCIEGEEEEGSEGLSKLLHVKKKELQADYLAVVDLGIPKPDQPSITLGVRGIVTFDMEVEGSKTDLHSGFHGGIVYNPIHALIDILSRLRDENGSITVPGFYDDVILLKKEDKEVVNLDFDAEGYKTMFDAIPSGGESAYSPCERAWTRPTLEINGISGGYSGKGFKTVIPAKASAKISCRIVPSQDPVKIGNLVVEHIKRLAPEGIKVDICMRPGIGGAVRSPVSSKIIQAFARSYEEVFNREISYIYAGGSIPIVNELAQASGSIPALVGLGLPGDQIHAPNEHFGIDRLEKGCLIIARTIELLGR